MLFNRAGKHSTIVIRTKRGQMPKHPCRHLFAASCVLVLPFVALSQTPSSTSPLMAISMQQAVDIARMKNPTLLSAQQNLLSVKAQEIQAGVRSMII